jgi:hypothetical protein
MAPGRPAGAVRGVVEWEVTNPGLAPVAIVFAPVVVKRYPTSREYPAIIRAVPNAVPR